MNSLRSLDGYRMMASSIDNRIGEIRFLMLGTSGNANNRDVFEILAEGFDRNIDLDIQYLVDELGNDISYEMRPFEGMLRSQQVNAFGVEKLGDLIPRYVGMEVQS